MRRVAGEWLEGDQNASSLDDPGYGGGGGLPDVEGCRLEQVHLSSHNRVAPNQNPNATHRQRLFFFFSQGTLAAMILMG